MNLLPVIQRELRAQVRQPVTYTLRFIGAGAILLTTAGWALVSPFSSRSGQSVFNLVHVDLLLLVWVIVPLAACDSISRERRENTLGLLCLTPLSPPDIVFSKLLVHGLRAFTLWLAAIPALAIPVLLGGVTWQDALGSGTLVFTSLLCALAAGIIGSACARRWHAAVIGAGLCSGFFFLLLAFICGLEADILGGGRASGGESVFSDMLLNGLLFLLVPAHQSELWFNAKAGAFGIPISKETLLCLAALVGLGFMAIMVAAWLGAGRIRTAWHSRENSPLADWANATFCTPVMGRNLLSRWLGRHLERNPIGWLERRRWSGRLITWAWLAVLITVLSLGLGTDVRFMGTEIEVLFQALALLLVFCAGFTAAGSFRRERETGVMELLLVSPVPVHQIISGRLVALWGQFVPAVVLLAGSWVYLQSALHWDHNLVWLWLHVFSWFTASVIGLYFSLRARDFMRSFLGTMAFTLVLPWFLATFGYGVMRAFGELFPPWAAFHEHAPIRVVCVQSVLILVCLSLLYQNLARRRFVLSSGSG